MKHLFVVALFMAHLTAGAQDADIDYQLSTHILDISTGQPAPGVSVALEKTDDSSDIWAFVAKKETGEDGRIDDFLPMPEFRSDSPTTYRLTFYTRPYFEEQGTKSFYPYIQVVFEIEDGAHYHVPITVAPFGYTTYRGS